MLSALELEGPEEVIGLLEVGPAGPDLVDQVLDADDAVLPEHALDALVRAQRDALFMDLAVAAFINEVFNGRPGGVAPRDGVVHELQHVERGLVQLHEDAVVDLAETQKLEDLADLGRVVVESLAADDQGDLGLGLDEDAALEARLPLAVDDGPALGLVLLLVLGGLLQVERLLALEMLLVLLLLLYFLRSKSSLALLQLKDVFWDGLCLLSSWVREEW